MAPSKKTTGTPAKLPIECLDLTAKRREYLFTPPRFVTSLVKPIIRGERDLPMVYTQMNILFTVLPWAISLYFIPRDLWGGWGKPAICAVYLFYTFFFFLQRFVLMLHFNAHLGAWTGPTKLGAKALNNLNEIVLAPLFGMPAGQYFLHHVVMHHKENNVFPYDVSSTEPYQRDNFLHFLHYWARFFFAAHFELPIYAFSRKRYGLCLYSLAFLFGNAFVYYSLYKLDTMATMTVLILPFCLCSFALMFGNWSQHIFVDPERPSSNYALTYNCMNTPENQLTFNDGYHIVHHIISFLHWTELPKYFLDHMDEFAAQDAFLFDNIGFFDVGLYCMTGQLNKLAKHYVSYGQVQRTEEEIVAEFKRRMVPIDRTKKKAN